MMRSFHIGGARGDGATGRGGYFSVQLVHTPWDGDDEMAEARCLLLLVFSLL